ncbi:signal peptide peptidase SppA [bacterium]|nr:signal peptide peptidase SppA [bacterium]
MRSRNKIFQALLVFVIVAAALVTGASLLKSSGSFADGRPRFGSNGSEAALIKINGIITSSGGDSGIFGGASVASSMRLVKDIKEYAEDDSIAGIIVRVDSPGGSAAASDEIWHALRKASDAKPVVISMGDVAASGGYYVSTAGDYLFANPSTLTGSIGVIFDMIEYSGLFEKLGITSNTLHAGEYKDIGSYSRPMTDEERTMLQKLLDQVHEQFIAKVAEGRGMEIEEVRKLATGMIFTGEQAADNGLVDDLGGFEDAFAKLEELCGEELVMREPPPPSFWDFFSGGFDYSAQLYNSGPGSPLESLAAKLYLSSLAVRMKIN